MKVCPRDNETRFENENFCFYCGSKLVEREDPKCPKCQKVVFGKYCVYCGQPLNKEKNEAG